MADTTTAPAAIAAALNQNWKEAIRINTALLKDDKQNTESMNRLGHAYLMSGQLTSAKRTYEKVLTTDPYNQIAQRNIKKLLTLRKKDVIRHPHKQISPLLFLEEPGKTKIIYCVNLAPTQKLSALTPGEEVLLKAKNHCVEVRNSRGDYLAGLPDDLSYKLIKLIASGNKYEAFIKAVGKNSLAVFLRETHRSRRFTHQPSFASQLSNAFVPTIRSDSETDRPDVTPTGEKDEDDATSDAPNADERDIT
ncbi:MAG: Tetratricopeptide TPR_2 repeat protein [Microgenomates group bacterium GW2011_GWA2_47_8]|nr:MAG: Tetratricopeptide TPR_2 repeat protein [Microgenomates group bacterium GW2011_GWA2_47_8]